MIFKWLRNRKNSKDKNIVMLANIFPTYLLEDIKLIEKNLDMTSQHRSYKPFDVISDGRILSIPARIYLDKDQIMNIKKLTHIQKEIAYCFFTRHHDGFVRERCLKEIINSNNSFVIPYVIQLLGEYVIEIIDVIYQNRNKINQNNFVSYIKENPKHYEITKQRVYSYWNCNYRKFYPKYGRGVKYRGKCHLDYPGIKMIKYIDKLISNN